MAPTLRNGLLTGYPHGTSGGHLTPFSLLQRPQGIRLCVTDLHGPGRPRAILAQSPPLRVFPELFQLQPAEFLFESFYRTESPFPSETEKFMRVTYS